MGVLNPAVLAEMCGSRHDGVALDTLVGLVSAFLQAPTHHGVFRTRAIESTNSTCKFCAPRLCDTFCRDLEEEADALDRELEKLEADKKGLEEKAAAEKADAKAAIESLEGRMQQQEEAHEREFEEQQAEKR